MTIKPKFEKFVLASLRDAGPAHVRYTMRRALHTARYRACESTMLH